jgi:hypothetical protein
MNVPVRPTLLLVAALVAGAACSPRPVNVRRSAVGPHLGPPTSSGQPLPEKGAFGVHASNLLFVPDPEATPELGTGIYVPRTQLELMGQGRVWRSLELSVVFGWSLATTAGPVTTSVPQRPAGGDVYGFGFGTHYTLFEGAPLQLGLELDLIAYLLPIRLEQSAAPTIEARQLVGVYSFSFLPSYRRSDRLTFFAGITARNHPDIELASTEVLRPGDGPEAATTGPPNLLVTAGIEVRATDRLMLQGRIYQTLTRRPVAYPGPGVDVGILILLGDGAPAPRAPDVAPPPLLEAPPSPPEDLPPPPPL